MGMPREATIFREVGKVCQCLDVRLTSGGSSWLHAVIKIRKAREEDPRNALEAAFKGHPSLKHAIVVDEDIDIDDPNAVEWALATRAQFDRDLIIMPGQYGSSLDPSADQVTRKTSALCKAYRISSFQRLIPVSSGAMNTPCARGNSPSPNERRKLPSQSNTIIGCSPRLKT